MRARLRLVNVEPLGKPAAGRGSARAGGAYQGLLTMIAKSLTKLAALSVLALWAADAQATTFNLNLTGSVANEQFASFDSGGTHFDQGYIVLDPFSPITIAQGDTVNVTLTLDGPFTIPASVDFTNFTIDLSGANFPAINTDTDGSIQLFSGLTQVGSSSITTNPGVGTADQIAMVLGLSPPDNGAVTFDNLTASLTPIDLSQNATLDEGLISYTLFSPSAVPEPAAWALMLLGFGGLGAVLRRKRAMAMA